jgi:hypothetical protein
MATLELEFNCMCLFVTDPQDGTVHVLMPATGSHHGGHQRHVVRVLHRSFVPNRGRSMEGWALDLRGDPVPPERPAPSDGAGPMAEIPDLTAVSKQKVQRRLVADWSLPDEVAARVTLRGGRMMNPEGEGTRWMLNDKPMELAHKVVWRMENVSEALTWIDLGGNHGPPIRSLSELDPESADTYRLSLYHVSEHALPPTPDGQLSEKEVRDHFAMYYRLLRVEPQLKHLPKLETRFAGRFDMDDGDAPHKKLANKTYNCKLAAASL